MRGIAIATVILLFGIQPRVVVGARLSASESELSNVTVMGLESCDNAANFDETRSLTRCRVGVGPTTYGFQQWEPGQACSHYYSEVRCLARRGVTDVHRMKAERGGGYCQVPELRMEDCTMLADSVVAEDFLKSEEILGGMIRRGPNEWMKIPSSTAGVKSTGKHFEYVIMEWFTEEESELAWSDDVSLVGSEIEDVWSILLHFCAGAEDRALGALTSRYDSPTSDARAQARKESKHECQKFTQLDIFAHYHPALKAAKAGFTGVPNTLEAMQKLGVFGLSPDLWRTLCMLGDETGGVCDRLCKEVQARAGAMVTKAKSYFELELALALEGNSMLAGAKAEGGQERLKEVKLKAYLDSVVAYPSGRNKFEVDRQLQILDVLMKDGLKWVDTDEMNRLVAVIKSLDDSAVPDEECSASNLDPGCSHLQLHCVLSGLDSECTPVELKDHLELVNELRITCVYLELPADCTMEDIKDRQTRIRACVVAGLPQSCTQEDLEELEIRPKRCQELNLAPECTRDDINFAEALVERCQENSLPADCTPEDLENVLAVEEAAAAAARDRHHGRRHRRWRDDKSLIGGIPGRNRQPLHAEPGRIPFRRIPAVAVAVGHFEKATRAQLHRDGCFRGIWGAARERGSIVTAQLPADFRREVACRAGDVRHEQGEARRRRR